MPKDKNESDALSFETGASDRASTKAAEARVAFPRWKCVESKKYGEYNVTKKGGHNM